MTRESLMVEVSETAARVLLERLEETDNELKPVRVVFQGYG